MSEKEKTFEEAFARLETILEKMNSGSATLDDSLKLYEEADELINTCQKRLTEAEKKIESLQKNRNGEVMLNADQKPLMQEFNMGQGQR